jgi:tetratricopeptide (TPR) repeat protein
MRKDKNLPSLSTAALDGDPGFVQALKERGAVLVPERLRRYAPVIALLAGVFILAAIWKLISRSGNFPRRESEFLSVETLDRRLERAAQRLKADPDDIKAMVESGVLLFQKGKDFYPDAINDLDDAWEHGALDARIFYYMGVMYQEEGLYRDATKQYMMFLRNRPNDEEVRLLAAKLLYQSGQFEDAAAQYRELQKRRSQDTVVRENLALSLQALKRYDEAKSQLQALEALGPAEERRAHFYLGQIASEQGDFREAMRQYLAVMPLEGRPDIGIPPLTVYIAAAENYDKLNASAMARDTWENVVRLDPKNTHAKSRLRALNIRLNKNKKRSGRSRKR